MARWMRGGGGECYYPDEERPSPARVAWHSLDAYGFLATFLATGSPCCSSATPRRW